MSEADSAARRLRLTLPVDPGRDHVRGVISDDGVVVVGYQDFLCPYCRRLRQVMRRVREAMGDRLVYVFRHYPNERAHPGARSVARAAEAAGLQGKFFEMHDLLFDREPPFERAKLLDLAARLSLDVERFDRDLDSEALRRRVAEDVANGRMNGVSGTPTLFVDGLRYDGAWDDHSILEALDRPLAARLHRSVRVFASLPTSAGLVLLLAAALAMLCANTPLAPLYARLVNARFLVGPPAHALSLSLRQWMSEGLMTLFFLVVGLEIRREVTRGALARHRAALLPVLAAFGGSVMPALVYRAINCGPTARGWAIPTATDVAFSLGVLALLGDRVPTGARAFVAALAVVDDVISIGTLGIFYPQSFSLTYVFPVILSVLGLVVLNRARVYAPWPYLAVGLALWAFLLALGVHPALTGVVLALCLPTLPVPHAAPLLAQTATALSTLAHAETEAALATDEQIAEGEQTREWAVRNVFAVAERFSSPAERIERAIAPWAAFAILPAFAFTASGVSLHPELTGLQGGPIFAGIFAGLVVGKPLGVLLASALAIGTGAGVFPDGVTIRQFVGAACLCGVADTMSLLMADTIFQSSQAEVAKLAVIAGSVVAGVVGASVLAFRAVPRTAVA